jgi:hypothetical protein
MRAACGSGGGGGDVSGPGASTVNDVVFWNNTLGTLVSDPGTLQAILGQHRRDQAR